MALLPTPSSAALAAEHLPYRGPLALHLLSPGLLLI